MKKLKVFFAILLVFIIMLSMIGCSSVNTMERIQKDKKIVWGTNAAFPPFEMKKGNDVIGIDAEIAQKVAEKLGVDLITEDMEFEALPAALKSGKVDFIAAGYTVKPEREKNMTFSDKYFKAVQVIIVQKDNNDINGPDDLKNKKIGVQLGTTGDIDVASEIEGAEVSQYNTVIEAVLDLKNGKIDAVIIDNLPAQMLAAQNPEIKILEEKAAAEEEYAIAVRKGDQELINVINEVIAEVKEKDQMEELVNKYFIGE